MPAETAFKPEFTDRARSMAELGATDREIAEEFGVSERTINRWKHTQPGFAEQLKLGKDAADERVEQSLYRRATGYSFDAVKVFQYQGQPVVCEHVEHVPPDTTAAIFWLKNRRKDDWRDKHVVEHEDPDALLRAIVAGNARVESQPRLQSTENELTAEGAALRRALEHSGSETDGQ